MIATEQDDIAAMARVAGAQCKQLRQYPVSKNIVEAILVFEDLKKTAQSVEEIYVWLSQNLAILIQLDTELRNHKSGKPQTPLQIHNTSLAGVMDCALSPTSTAFTSVILDFKCSTMPELDDVWDFLGITAFPGMFFKDMDNWYGGSFDLILFGKEYPLVAARNIFTLLSYEKDRSLLTAAKIQGHGLCNIVHQKMNEDIGFHERILTLLSTHFPQIPSEAFMSMAHAGLLPDQISEFTSWMTQYKPPAPGFLPGVLPGNFTYPR